jgi:hypothetical protein
MLNPGHANKHDKKSMHSSESQLIDLGLID